MTSYTLVPREATDEMLVDMCELDCTEIVCQTCLKCQNVCCKKDRQAGSYAAMLAAAQEIARAALSDSAALADEPEGK
jgi:hypothetical protein